MSHLSERDGVLHVEDVALADLAAEVGTPAYVYSTAAMTEKYDGLRAALAGALGEGRARICYALKANSNLAVVVTLAARGAGADVVSEGELRQALAAGIAPADIVFSGVGKTRRELRLALDVGIGQINVESEPELHELSRLAQLTGRTAPVALRVNPDVDAETHAKITTGRADHKFGIDIGEAPALWRRGAALPGIQMVGLAVHIGSQLTSLAPFRAAFERVAALARALGEDGAAVSRLDLGGGLGVRYTDEAPPPAADYAALVAEVFGDLGASLTFEPGRYLVAEAGVLLTRVIYVKPGRTRSFVIVDAAMNDLLRPSLYDARHEVRPVISPAPDAPRLTTDIVGPICETGDVLAREREMAAPKSGDLLAILDCGAYGAVMSSAYNLRPPAPEILVNGGEYAVIRPRRDYDRLLGEDKLPDWLAPKRTVRPSGAAQ